MTPFQIPKERVIIDTISRSNCNYPSFDNSFVLGMRDGNSITNSGRTLLFPCKNSIFKYFDVTDIAYNLLQSDKLINSI